MRILALDIATKCGWAYGDLDGLKSGSWNFEPRRDQSKGMRLINFKAEINRIRQDGIGLVVFEAASGMHKGALVVMAEMHGVLKELCETAGIEYRSYTSNQIKMYATGNGRAKKHDMLGAAIHKFGVDCEGDEDRADALALWHLAYSEYGDGDGIAPEPLTPEQIKAKAKAQKPKKRKPKVRSKPLFNQTPGGKRMK